MMKKSGDRMGKKTAIIYVSSTGNTEAMAEAVAVGAKANSDKILLAPVSDVRPEDIAEGYDCIFLGSPAMGIEVIEESQMKPFCEALKPLIAGKRMAVFGSCGWSRGAWLNAWQQSLKFAGAIFPAKPVLAYGYPDEEAMKNCEELGNIVTSLK
jgi:flavodoxin I